MCTHIATLKLTWSMPCCRGCPQGVAMVAISPCISKLAILRAFSGFWVCYCVFWMLLSFCCPPGKNEVFCPPPSPRPPGSPLEKLLRTPILVFRPVPSQTIFRGLYFITIIFLFNISFEIQSKKNINTFIIYFTVAKISLKSIITI